MGTLKEEMEEAYSTAEKIREDMQNQKKKYAFVRATDKCCMCNNYLMAKPFHLFINCGHKFHTDCLIQALIPHLSQGRIRRIDELIASECIHCGDIMIKLIDKPFIEPEDFESV